MSTFTRNPNLDRTVVEQVVREIVEKRLGFSSGAGHTPDLVVNISARHMHIRQEDLEILFGTGTQLGVKRMLYQEGQFASEQAVTIIGPRHRTITNLRIPGKTEIFTKIPQGIYIDTANHSPAKVKGYAVRFPVFQGCLNKFKTCVLHRSGSLTAQAE